MAVKKKEEFPQIKITLVRSLIGRTEKQRAIVKGLGLGKISSSVIREKRPEIIGMVQKVDFLLHVEEVVHDSSRKPKASQGRRKKE